MLHLKEIRKAKRMRAEDLAEKTGLSVGQIWSYESGRREPPLDALCLLADALGVTLDEIVRGIKKEPSPEDRERLELAIVNSLAFQRLPPNDQEIALAILDILHRSQGL